MNYQDSFARILLEQEQRELLERVAEVSRNTSRDRRQKFYVLTHLMDNGATYTLSLPGAGKDGDNLSLGNVYMGDVEELDRQGLIALSSPDIVRGFDVTALGFRYYEYMKRQIGEPTQRVEQTISSYVAAASFRKKYALAYQRWSEAEAKLWSSDAENEFTTIGHLCREAMQEFAHALVETYKPTDVTSDKTKTIARIRAILAQKKKGFSTTVEPFLDALLVFWGTISDLVQRQEHGGQKEGQPLGWEDARRVVFQTLIVMYEIDRAL